MGNGPELSQDSLSHLSHLQHNHATNTTPVHTSNLVTTLENRQIFGRRTLIRVDNLNKNKDVSIPYPLIVGDLNFLKSLNKVETFRFTEQEELALFDLGLKFPSLIQYSHFLTKCSEMFSV